MQVFETGQMKGMGGSGVTEELIDSTDGPGTTEMNKSLSDAGIYVHLLYLMCISPILLHKCGQSHTYC